MDYLSAVPTDIINLILLWLPLNDATLEIFVQTYPQYATIVLRKNYWIDRLRHDRLGEWNDWINVPDIGYNTNFTHEFIENKLISLKNTYYRIKLYFRYTLDIISYLSDILPSDQIQADKISIEFYARELHDLNLLNLLVPNDMRMTEYKKDVLTYNKFLSENRKRTYLLPSRLTISYHFNNKKYELHSLNIEYIFYLDVNNIIDFISKLLYFGISIYETQNGDNIIEVIDDYTR